VEDSVLPAGCGGQRKASKKSDQSRDKARDIEEGHKRVVDEEETPGTSIGLLFPDIKPSSDSIVFPPHSSEQGEGDFFGYLIHSNVYRTC
jgi:hypothetical protein